MSAILGGHTIGVYRRNSNTNRFNQPDRVYAPAFTVDGRIVRIKDEEARLYVEGDPGIVDGDVINDAVDADGAYVGSNFEVLQVHRGRGMTATVHHVEITLSTMRLDIDTQTETPPADV